MDVVESVTTNIGFFFSCRGGTILARSAGGGKLLHFEKEGQQWMFGPEKASSQWSRTGRQDVFTFRSNRSNAQVFICFAFMTMKRPSDHVK